MASIGGPGEQGKLIEIVAYAIEREQEAVDFYAGLADRVKNQSLAAELSRMSGMELQHRRRLESIDVTAAAGTPARRVGDMKIADYTVAVQPSPDMTWQDIVNVAMHREMASLKLYQDLAASTEEPNARQLFDNLASEEAAHKLFFERVWDEEILREN